MNEQAIDQPSPVAAKRRRRLWTVIAVFVAILSAFITTSYWTHATGYKREQQAIHTLKTLLGDGSLRVVESQGASARLTDTDDVAAEIRTRWVSFDWLRPLLEAVGDPILERVDTVTIFDPDVDDSLIEPLSKFRYMSQLTVSGQMNISRNGFKELNNSVPNISYWIEHDDERFLNDGPNEDEEGDPEVGFEPSRNVDETDDGR